MSTQTLGLNDFGRRIYETRRRRSQQNVRSDENGRKRRIYVDGRQLQRANSAYVERAEQLRSDHFAE